MTNSDNTRFDQLLRKFDPESRLVRTWPLMGGISAQVTAIEVERGDGGRQKMIVRRHGDEDFAQNPHVAADEYKLLQTLKSNGLPVPKPYYVDETDDLFGRPCIVVEYVEGETIFEPDDLHDFARQLAAVLAQIHQVSTSELSFLPRYAALLDGILRDRPAQPDDSLDEGRIRDALEKAWPLPARNTPVLLHGDYWPGNVLWRNGQIAGVIDWEDSRIGDPISDVAYARMEIVWSLGEAVMQDFTGAYQTLMPNLDYSDLPYWDLVAALRPAGKLHTWALDAAAEKRMREWHHWFVGQALGKVSG